MSGPRNYDLGPEDLAEADAHYKRLSAAERVVQLIDKDAIIRALEARHEEALRMGSSDDLTGVLNRRGLRQEYDRSRARRQREQDQAKPDLMLVIDLDDFKSINTNEGHDGGDKTLMEVAGIIGVTVRAGDAVGRSGGDEFVAYLYGATIEEGSEVAERLRLGAEIFNEKFSGVTIPTLSIGVAEIDPYMDFEESFKLADAAMYEAKQTGKNQVHVLAAGHPSAG